MRSHRASFAETASERTPPIVAPCHRDWLDEKYEERERERRKSGNDQDRLRQESVSGGRSKRGGVSENALEDNRLSGEAQIKDEDEEDPRAKEDQSKRSVYTKTFCAEDKYLGYFTHKRIERRTKRKIA